jgi:hypothetical protein
MANQYLLILMVHDICSNVKYLWYYHNYGKSPFFMGQTTISMAIFNSELLNYQRVHITYTNIKRFSNSGGPPCSPGRCFLYRESLEDSEERNGNLVLKSIIYTEIYNLIKDT